MSMDVTSVLNPNNIASTRHLSKRKWLGMDPHTAQSPDTSQSQGSDFIVSLLKKSSWSTRTDRKSASKLTLFPVLEVAGRQERLKQRFNRGFVDHNVTVVDWWRAVGIAETSDEEVYLKVK